LSAQKIRKSKETEVRVYTVSPPSYRIEVLAENYKKAEDLLQNAADTVLENITKVGGEGTFKREK